MKLIYLTASALALTACAQPEPIQDYNAPYTGKYDPPSVTAPKPRPEPRSSIFRRVCPRDTDLWPMRHWPWEDPRTVCMEDDPHDPMMPPPPPPPCPKCPPPPPPPPPPAGGCDGNPGNNKCVGKATENPTGEDKHYSANGVDSSPSGSTGASKTSREGDKGPHKGGDNPSAKSKKGKK